MKLTIDQYLLIIGSILALAKQTGREAPGSMRTEI
jgi:hypothetical protein